MKTSVSAGESKAKISDHHSEEDDQQRCLDVISEAVSAEPGILGVTLAPQRQEVSFNYDPAQISEQKVEQIAQHLTPSLQHNLETCTMRLGHHGGRACEVCASLLEGRISQIQGVRKTSASYLAGALSITFDNSLISSDQLFQRVKQFGVSVAPSAAELPAVTAPVEVAPTPFRRLWAWLTQQNPEAIFTVITLVMMLTGWLAETMGAPAYLSATAYTVAYLAGGAFGLKAGFESLREGAIDVDLLMVLAAIGAALVGAPFEGVLLLFLFSLSNVLQDYALDRTRNAIRALMKLRPSQALVRRGKTIVTLPVEEVVIGDHFLVRPGDRIPLDGLVLEGESAVDQSSLTGESMPVAKSPGDTILAGTINKNGSLEVQVTKTAKDTTIARLIKLVEEAQSEKAQTQRFLDKAEQYYATGVIGFTILAIIIPVLLLGEDFNPAFYRAMTLMVAASPCAVIISTPAAILSAIGNGARKGILFKGGVYLEQAAGIKVVAFDKTGTLTEGAPQVTDIKVIATETTGGWQGNEDDLLALAAAVEARSEHPLAQATVEAAQARNLKLAEATAFQASTGQGVSGSVNGLKIQVGNLRHFAAFNVSGLAEATAEVERLQAEGKTAVAVAHITADGDQAYLLGVIAFADRLRADAPQVVRQLKSLGVEQVVMLTGDNERVAQAMAKQAGVDRYYANLLPEDKLRLIKELEKSFGLVAMVGDGVNDAPALASAPIGIAMGAAGTDVALETADIVLMADNLANIPYVIALSRQTRKTLIVNLTFAMTMIALMIIAIFAANLSLPLAVVGHEGGTVLVSLNGLRLLVYNPNR